MKIEIETLDELDAHLAAGQPLSNTVLQGLDLRSHTQALLQANFTGCVLLGCQLEAPALQAAQRSSTLVFPHLPELPYHVYRGLLYTAEELYAGFDPDRPDSYLETLDARVYHHWKNTGGVRPASILETLARRLHDHAITDALDELLHPEGEPDRKVVAIMGGHGMPRGRGHYLDVARIAHRLTNMGYFMASGGGPGAMEATHLGAYFANRPEDLLAEACDILAQAPMYNDERWLSCAFEVRMRFPLEERDTTASIGIPTWLYGHEPPNAFATHIAKYFANSVREEGLITIAKNGIIFSPGSAGTIQEIFQDACQNHYNSVGIISPMVFLGEGYWSWKKPVFPLLAHLAAGKAYASLLTLTDDIDAVVAAIVNFDAP